jgi:tryptophan-rich sensory protein
MATARTNIKNSAYDYTAKMKTITAILTTKTVSKAASTTACTISTLFQKPEFSIMAPIVAAALMNGWIASVGGFKTAEIKPKLLPPGYVVGTIWVILIGTLGYLHHLLYREGGWSTACQSIEAFLLYSLSYSVFVNYRPTLSKALNLIALVAAFVVALFVAKERWAYVGYMVPLLLWGFFVNYIFL